MMLGGQARDGGGNAGARWQNLADDQIAVGYADMGAVDEADVVPEQDVTKMQRGKETGDMLWMHREGATYRHIMPSCRMKLAAANLSSSLSTAVGVSPQRMECGLGTCSLTAPARR